MMIEVITNNINSQRSPDFTEYIVTEFIIFRDSKRCAYLEYDTVMAAMAMATIAQTRFIRNNDNNNSKNDDNDNDNRLINVVTKLKKNKTDACIIYIEFIFE